MAGTIRPIAPLTDDDHGPINTIVSIVLPITSVLIATVRMAMRQKKFLQLGSDDVVFGIGLCFGIITSILSHFCVRAGLGRHQRTLDDEQVAHYSKLFWTTQMFGIISLSLAKLSLVLLFKRIAPKPMGPQTDRYLIPMVSTYSVLCLFLIAFQCQLPRPWVLSPSKCTTHGNIYYPVTTLNMLTDAVLAVWIFPLVWSLQMKVDTKSIIMWLFGSRLLVCVVDAGRMIVIRRALQSEDQTRSQLLWAIMDQIIVHLSLNHATLPRIQTFLSNLQIGPMANRHAGSQPGLDPSSRSRSNPAVISSSLRKKSHNHSRNRSTSEATTTTTTNHDVSATPRKAWTAIYTSLAGSTNRKTPSISEEPLNLLPPEDIELSTTVYSSNDNRGKKHHGEQGRSAATSLSSEDVGREFGSGGVVRVQKDIHVVYDRMENIR